MFSLLLAAVVTFVGAKAANGPARLIGLTCSAAILIIVVLSMSRSTWLALALMALVVMVTVYPRSKVMRALTPSGVPLLLALAVCMFSFTNIPWIIIDRLLDSGSYAGRASVTEDRLAAFDAASVLTGLPLKLPWSHHIFIDYLTATGIIGGLVAAALLSLSFLRIIALCVSAINAKATSAQFYFVVAACLIIMPVTRFVTAPKGHPFLAQWVALGIAGALIALTSREAQNKLAGITIPTTKSGPRAPV